jgi:hypothetical protein
MTALVSGFSRWYGLGVGGTSRPISWRSSVERPGA